MTSVAESVEYRKYAKVSDEDLCWFVEQKPCVQQLWGECLRAEKYGESFNKIETRLSKNSFSEAKRELDGTRFEFQPIQRRSKSGQYKTTGWKVRNLHGSKIADYWRKSNHNAGNQDSRSTGDFQKVSQNLGELSQEMGEPSQKVCELKPVALDTTAFDSSLLGFYNSPTILEVENENLSTETRSGRLELEASTKVAASAPSPGASVIEKKSFATSQDLGSSKDPEFNEENPDLFANAHGLRHAEDLGSTEPSRSSSQQKSITSTECVSIGGDNKIPLAPHAVLPQSDTQSHHDAPEASRVEPTVECSTEPPQPAVSPLVGANGKSFDDIYLETRMNYSQRNLKLPLWELRLTAFERLLRAGQLRPIASWIKDEALADDLVGDYLLLDDEYPDELLVVLAGKARQLTPWSQLPEMVFGNPEKPISRNR